MYRLLIVDDEPIIVEGLYELFMKYNKHDIQVYKAYSSDSAVDLLEKNRMDVVLTDIRMPGMDGLQLMEIIRSNWPCCKVVFLTGHDEFEYVYKAIQHDNVRYLLKSENYSIVFDTVGRCFDEIEKELRDDELINKAGEQMKKAMPLLQKEFLSGLIDGTNQEYAQRLLDELQIPLRADMPVTLAVGRFDSFSGMYRTLEVTQRYYAIRIMTDRFLAPMAGNANVLHKGSTVVWFIQPERCGSDDAQRLAPIIKGAFESVQAVSKESMGVLLSVALAGEPVRWSDIPDKFASLCTILNSKIGAGMGMILADETFYSSESGSMFSAGQAGHKLQSRMKRLDFLNVCLEEGRKEEFFASLGDLRTSLGSYLGVSSLACEAYSSISALFLSYINRSNISEKIFSSYSIGELIQVDRFSSPEEAFLFFERLALDVFSIQNTVHEIRSAAAVRQALQYIQEHLDADLSLVRLAELVYFNPKYFSRLFKQVVGVHLSEYINDLKINRAKELLAANQMKITEIAYCLGYLSAPYFTRFFKKTVNMTPQEYRLSALRNR